MERVNFDQGALALRPYKLLDRGSDPSRSQRDVMSPFNFQVVGSFSTYGKLVKFREKMNEEVKNFDCCL